MVVLGGLEIAAVGYLLNEFNKNKVEERERRKHSNHRPDHDRPHDERPHSRPHSNSRPQPYHPQDSSANLLAPPQMPARPLSAPPQDLRPEWQRQQGYQQQGQYMSQQFPNQQPMSMPNNNPPQRPSQGPSGDAYAFQSQLWQKQQAQQPQQHRPSQPSHLGPGPHQPPAQYQPQQLQRPQTFQQGQQHPPNQPYLQSSNTFPQPQSQQFQQGPPPQQPFLQHQNTFPDPNQNFRPPLHQQQQQPQFRPQTAPAPVQQQPPTGPLVYINTKTGKVSHNLYPADHPMHRPATSTSGFNPNLNASSSNLSLARASTDLGEQPSLPREFWGDERYTRTMAGDVHTGMMWSEKDDEDLAYGKDYGVERGQRKREKERQRGRKESIGRERSYERVRMG